MSFGWTERHQTRYQPLRLHASAGHLLVKRWSVVFCCLPFLFLSIVSLERERKRETDRQTDRDRKSQTERERQTDRQRQEETERETEIETDIQRQRDRQTDRQTQTETERERQRQKQRQTDRHRQRERQRHGHFSSVSLLFFFPWSRRPGGKACAWSAEDPESIPCLPAQVIPVI